MSSPPKRSFQTRGSNNPTRNALHPPRGARSAVACRALTGAPTRPPRGARVSRAAERVRSPGGSGRAAGRARRPHSRVAVPLPTTAAGVVVPRWPPRPPAAASSPGASGAPAVVPVNTGPRGTTAGPCYSLPSTYAPRPVSMWWVALESKAMRWSCWSGTAPRPRQEGRGPQSPYVPPRCRVQCCRLRPAWLRQPCGCGAH